MREICSNLAFPMLMHSIRRPFAVSRGYVRAGLGIALQSEIFLTIFMAGMLSGGETPYCVGQTRLSENGNKPVVETVRNSVIFR